jgi:hypothetical protein
MWMRQPCRSCLNRTGQRHRLPTYGFIVPVAGIHLSSYTITSKHVLEAFLSWLKEQMPRVLPKSALGKAIKYCRTQWERLEAFLEDGRLEIDNNRGERSIKPFVIGRKNWLFSNTSKGARSSTIIYSVVKTAKENELDPFNYLSYLFQELPNIDTTDKTKLAEFLPWSPTLPQECRVPKKSK